MDPENLSDCGHGPEYFFELSGELGNMPAAEAAGCVRAETDGNFSVADCGPGYAVISLPEKNVPYIAERLALTHGIGRYIGSFSPENISGFDFGELPEGTFAVRAKRFRGMMSGVDSQKLVRTAGDAYSSENRVDLKNPDTVVRLFMSDRVHVYIEEYKTETDLFEKRKVGERPFFSPISLHPKYARALINLISAKRGETVLDPFCGTGGIAIEAAIMGMKAVISDFDPQMVAGTEENIAYYGLKLHGSSVLDIGDISECWHNVDAVVTDPPYGRSTKTGGEDINHIYSRAFESVHRVLRPGGGLGIILPCEASPPGFETDGVYPQRVHRSLTRYYHAMRRV